jgi:ABC-2 type transport system ATP-binding protein
VHGSGEQSRDFTFVGDVARGCILAMETPLEGCQVINLACGGSHSVLDILNGLKAHAGVDVELRRELWQYLRDLHSQGKTILLTTHYIEEAELLCENVAIIHEGKILKEGSPKDLTRELGKAGITVQLGDVVNGMESYLNEFTFTRDENRLHFSVKDPDSAMPEIIRQLSKADVHIQSIESKVSSLEDVFLSLTGKGINE